MEIWKKTLNYLGLDPEDLGEAETLAAEDPSARPDTGGGASGLRQRIRGGVRRLPGSRPYWSVHVAEPGAYADAKEIGDRLRAGTSVIMNLEQAEEDVLKRMVAFASGLAYGIEGGIRTVAPHLYLVTPPEVSVTGQAPRRRRRRQA
ncbi:MAG: cell division protein SepF [Actinomycetota bacterium]